MQCYVIRADGTESGDKNEIVCLLFDDTLFRNEEDEKVYLVRSGASGKWKRMHLHELEGMVPAGCTKQIEDVEFVGVASGAVSAQKKLRDCARHVRGSCSVVGLELEDRKNLLWVDCSVIHYPAEPIPKVSALDAEVDLTSEVDADE